MTKRAFKKDIKILDANTKITMLEKEEIFQSHQKSIKASDNETDKQLSKEYLVNKLNFTNFQDGTHPYKFQTQKI